MKNFLLLFLILANNLFNVNSQGLNKSETLDYINSKLKEYCKAGDIPQTIEINGQILTVTEKYIHNSNGSTMIRIYKVNFMDLKPKVEISSGLYRSIYLNCNSTFGSVTTTLNGKYEDASYHSRNYISIEVETNEENRKYLCNAFNHLIDLYQNEKPVNISDPFANPQGKSASTSLKPTSSSNSTNKTTASSNPTLKTYTSSRYGYSINVLSSFTKTTPIGSHIDMKFAHSDGASFSINVSQKTAEEYGMTGHDLSREFFEQIFKQEGIMVTINSTEKLYLAGEKAFKIVYNTYNPDYKFIEFWFYHGSYAYVINACSKPSTFPKHEAFFLKTINTLRF